MFKALPLPDKMIQFQHLRIFFQRKSGEKTPLQELCGWTAWHSAAAHGQEKAGGFRAGGWSFGAEVRGGDC